MPALVEIYVAVVVMLLAGSRGKSNRCVMVILNPQRMETASIQYTSC